jgi:hypothetical protein
VSDIHQLCSLAHFPFLPSLSLLFPSSSFLIPHSPLFPSRCFQSPPVFLYLSSPITSILFLRYCITPYQFLRFLYPAAALHFSPFFLSRPLACPFPQEKPFISPLSLHYISLVVPHPNPPWPTPTPRPHPCRLTRSVKLQNPLMVCIMIFGRRVNTTPIVITIILVIIFIIKDVTMCWSQDDEEGA